MDAALPHVSWRLHATTFLARTTRHVSKLQRARAQNTDPLRFSPRMGAALAPHWRKSSQWFALLRAHAALVLGDQRVLALFAASCRAAWDADVQRRVLAPASSLMPHALTGH